MKAVNLIPADERRSGHPAPATYGLLGGLAVVVALSGAYAATGKSIHDKQAEIAAVKAQADAAEAKTVDLKPYGDFATLRKQRTDTVSQLASTRFDWGHALHEVARTIPSDTSLSTLKGTVPAATPGIAAGAQPAAAAGAATSGAAAAGGPTLDLSGCTGGQAATARLMIALRRIDGVQDVTLASSQKGGSASATPGSTSSSSSGDCTGNRTQFSMTLTFRAPAAAAAATTTPAATTASAGSTR